MAIQTVKDAATVLHKPDSSLTTTDEETAEVLKNQYKKIFVTEPPFDPSNITVGIADGPSIENVSFDSSKVLHKLRRMRTDGSPGPGLHLMVLVNCAASVAEPLAVMFRNHFSLLFFHLTGSLQTSYLFFKKVTKRIQIIIDQFLSLQYHVRSWNPLLRAVFQHSLSRIT